MKLKCLSHERRVLVVSNSDSFLHRTGDMSKCDGKTAMLVDDRSRTIRSYGIRPDPHVPGAFELREIGCDKQTNKTVALEDLTIDLTRNDPQE